MKKGLFITFEGIDGSGKTTQIKKLDKYLNEKKIETVVTRDPGGTDISEAIRNIALNNKYTNMSNETEVLLYCSSRAQLVNEIIIPTINSSKTVLCDRFIDSTLAYQGFGRGFDLKTLEFLNNFVCKKIEPDVTFFFDIGIDIFTERFFNNNKDRIESESIEFHKKVIDGYNRLAKSNKKRIKKIDGRMDINSIFDEIITEVENLLRSC
jgi:dTMP kinase